MGISFHVDTHSAFEGPIVILSIGGGKRDGSMVLYFHFEPWVEEEALSFGPLWVVKRNEYKGD